MDKTMKTKEVGNTHYEKEKNRNNENIFGDLNQNTAAWRLD